MVRKIRGGANYASKYGNIVSISSSVERLDSQEGQDLDGSCHEIFLGSITAVLIWRDLVQYGSR
jgi:hypothetical protein